MEKDTSLPQINLESIQTCILNAKRLYNDAEKVSEETEFALIEFSLEELMKGWMLYFAYVSAKSEEFIKNKGQDSFETHVNDLTGLNATAFKTEIALLPKEAQEELKRVAKRLFEPPIKEAFSTHTVKLDYLADLITYLKFYFPAQMKTVDIKIAMGMASQIMGGYAKIETTTESRETAVKTIVNHLDSFKIDSLRILEKGKQNAIYVNLYKGNLISPEIHLFDSKELKWLTAFLAVELILETNVLIEF
jgi:hypothetical protein